MKHLTFIFVVLCILSCSKRSTPPNNLIRAVPGSDERTIVLINLQSDSTYLYGHPLGGANAIGWIDKQTLLVESGCCELMWYFKIDLANGKKYYYKPRDYAVYDRSLVWIEDTVGIKGLYKHLEENSSMVEIMSDSLFADQSQFYTR